MTDKMTLSRAKVSELTSNRLRLVQTDEELAMAKLVYESRFREYTRVMSNRDQMEETYPWLIGATDDFDPDDKQVGIVLGKYKALCERIDRIAEQLMGMPKLLQETAVKQEEYRIKAGTNISAAQALSYIVRLGAAAGKYIYDPRDKQAFLAEAAAMQADFLAQNPHLEIKTQRETVVV